MKAEGVLDTTHTTTVGKATPSVRPRRPRMPSIAASATNQPCGPYASDMHCSYNGKCISRACRCDAAWTGRNCETLNLHPAKRKLGVGYQRQEHGFVSSWGGSVIEADGTWYMAASEIANNCGMGQWTRGSQVVIATSSDPLNVPFVRRSLLAPAFAHEPTLMRGPAGELVAVYTHATTATPPGGPTCSKCTNGSSSTACGHNINPYNVRLLGRAFPTLMRWTDAASNYTRWSDPIELFNASAGRLRNNNTYCDNNLAGVILPNGSFVGIWRECSLPRTWATVHPVTSSLWSDPESYFWHDKRELWAHAGAYPSGVPDHPPPEDPMVWVGGDGVYHALFHDRSGDGKSHGGHAYSIDGFEWTYTGVAYDNVIEYDDGWKWAFSSRERPHLVMDRKGAPLALTSGVRYSQELTGDYSYTHLQPVGRF